MSVFAEPRQQEILSILNSGGQAVVSELAKRFSVSDMTIRRDLKSLEEKGLAVRVHGGAIAAASSRFNYRLSANSRAKAKAIGKLVSSIPDNGYVYLDGSTTMLGLVKHFKGRTNVQVATNNVETFNRLARLHGPIPLLIGGRLDSRTDNLIGPIAVRSVTALAFDAAFFSAWGIEAQTGLNEITPEDADVKEHVAARARLVYVSVDSSKLGLTAGSTWRQEREKSTLATDLEPDDPRVQPFAAMFGSII
jgi:Transcriptional regulators of sugar metabolism